MEAKLVLGFNGVPTTTTHRLTLLNSVFLSSSNLQTQITRSYANRGLRRRFAPVKSSNDCAFRVQASSSISSPESSTKLYVSGLSFRTTEEGLRTAFEKFGELVEVNLVMDRVANRPRGFAFLHYATEEDSQSAIQGMHGKFLDGRVIFVEVAKPKSQLRQSPNPNSRRY